MTRFQRRSIRLKGFDYSQQGVYFVTICTQDREYVFGEIVKEKMRLNRTGEIVETVWRELLTHYQGVQTDEFVIMPNHIHGIIWLCDVGAGFPRPMSENGNHEQGAETAPLQRYSLGQIVAYFKYQSTKQINHLRNVPGQGVWQRNYYERVIRNGDELFQIRQYIQENPLKWDLDPENPRRVETLNYR